MADSSSFILQVAMVAAIVAATRWLFAAKGAQLPKTRGDMHIYGVKWQVRVAGISIALLGISILVAFRNELVSASDRPLYLMFAAFSFLGLWLASGSVTTNQEGITKKALWFSRSRRWEEITAIRFYQRQNYIDLRAGSRKLSIDFRFVAIRHLLDEIVDHTRIQPTIK